MQPTLDNVLDEKNIEVPEGQPTVSTQLRLKGTASKGAEVEIYDGIDTGAVSKGTAKADTETGEWEKTIDVEVGSRRLYAKALYPVEPVYSNVRTLIVVAPETLKFTNAPYTVAPAGRVTAIELQLRTEVSDQPVEGIITITLPPGFSYADGGSETREFSTGIDGLLRINGIKANTSSGTSSFIAKRYNKEETAEITVTKLADANPIQLGKNSWGLALSADGLLLYIASPATNTITAIDTATHLVVDTIQGIKTPYDIQLTSDGERAYISNYQHNTVTLVYLKSNSPPKIIPVEQEAVGLTLNLDESKLYVCNRISNSISVIDTETFALSRIAVGQLPRQARMSPDGKSIYVCNMHNNFISAINIDTNETVSIATPDGTYDISFSLVDSYAYAISTRSTFEIDTNTHMVNRRFDNVVGWGISTNSSGTKLFTCDPEKNSVTTVLLPTGAIENPIRVGANPRQLISGSDSTRVYVSSFAGSDVFVLEV
ncbi:hypothetical protein EMIT0347P_250002 [Pseudomonas sp. IT-347P]